MSLLIEYKWVFNVLIILAVAVLISGCAKTYQISELKNDDLIGEEVTIESKVDNSAKIGKISGFTIHDKSEEKIGVSSLTLPKEGDSVKVTGILMKDTIFGYYIKANEVQIK